MVRESSLGDVLGDVRVDDGDGIACCGDVMILGPGAQESLKCIKFRRLTVRAIRAGECLTRPASPDRVFREMALVAFYQWPPVVLEKYMRSTV